MGRMKDLAIKLQDKANGVAVEFSEEEQNYLFKSGVSCPNCGDLYPYLMDSYDETYKCVACETEFNLGK